MAVWTLGLNHKTAPIDLRERFAFASERLDQSLKGLRQSFTTHKEVAILSTCNRTEIYCAGDARHRQMDCEKNRFEKFHPRSTQPT